MLDHDAAIPIERAVAVAKGQEQAKHVKRGLKPKDGNSLHGNEIDDNRGNSQKGLLRRLARDHPAILVAKMDPLWKAYEEMGKAKMGEGGRKGSRGSNYKVPQIWGTLFDVSEGKRDGFDALPR